MQSKISRQIFLITIIAEFIVFLILVFLIPKNLTRNDSLLLSTKTVIPPKQEQPSIGLPVRLKIPRINVDVTIESVGLTSDGAMDIPKNPDGVAWFNLVKRPGEIGSAVIDGHYGMWKNGVSTVFNNLNKLRQGDKISVEDTNGTTTAFVVSGSQLYSPQANVPNVFVSNDGKSHLNLITCEGAWNNVSKSYSGRLVVFSDKE